MNDERGHDLTAAVLALAIATERTNDVPYVQARENVLHSYHQMQDRAVD